MLRARLVRRRQRLERRRRHGPGDHLSAPDPRTSLERLLLSEAEAEALDAHGRTEAAVLIPVLAWPDEPRLVFTERRHDLNRHAGEISFPGGRRDPGETLMEAAIREANEEIALPPSAIDVVGALPPIGTFVTSYKVHPFVALIGDPQPRLTPNPTEVADILEFGIDELRANYGERRLIRRGVPFRTPTYTIGETLIWGATARILGELLSRLGD